MQPSPHTAAIATGLDDGAGLAEITRRRLAELDRLRDMGFVQLRRLNEATKALPVDQLIAKLCGPKGGMAEYERFSRAIRQIMVLEFELRGLFRAPDRDAPRKLRLVKSDRPGFEPEDRETDDLFGDLNDLNDLNDLGRLGIRTDYSREPIEQVVATIRGTLGAAPPANDPFAPRSLTGAEPAPPQPVTAEPVRAEPQKAEPELSAEATPLPVRPRPLTARPAAPVSAQKKPAVKAAVLAIKARGGKGFRKRPLKSRPGGGRRNRGPPE